MHYISASCYGLLMESLTLHSTRSHQYHMQQWALNINLTSSIDAYILSSGQLSGELVLGARP